MSLTIHQNPNQHYDSIYPLENHEIPENENRDSIDSILHDDLINFIVLKTDLPEKLKLMEISKKWRDITDKESQWEEIGKKFGQSFKTKEQVKQFFLNIQKKLETQLSNIASNDLRIEVNDLLKNHTIEKIHQLYSFYQTKRILIVAQTMQHQLPQLFSSFTLDLNIQNFTSIKNAIDTVAELKKWCKQNPVNQTRYKLLNKSFDFIKNTPHSLVKTV